MHALLQVAIWVDLAFAAIFLVSGIVGLVGRRIRQGTWETFDPTGHGAWNSICVGAGLVLIVLGTLGGWFVLGTFAGLALLVWPAGQRWRDRRRR